MKSGLFANLRSDLPASVVVFFVAVPLCLGIVLNMRRPDITARLRSPLKYVSMGIFVAYVTLALAANWAYFLQFAGLVAGLVVLHNGLALAGGHVTARLAGVSPFDRRAVTIETGIQNSGLGLVLIFGVIGVINFAHGEVMMTGAFLTWTIRTKYIQSIIKGSSFYHYHLIRIKSSDGGLSFDFHPGFYR